MRNKCNISDGKSEAQRDMTGVPGLDRGRVSKFVKGLTREDFGSVLVVRRHLTLPHPPLLHRGTRNCSASHHTN